MKVNISFSPALATLMVCLALAPAAAIPQRDADEPAIKELSEKLLFAQRNKDLDGVMACWSVRSPQFNAYRKFVQYDIASSDDTEFINVTYRRWAIETDKAFVRLQFVRKWRHARTKRLSEQTVIWDVRFVKENDNWRFWQQDVAVNVLAWRLDTAKTREDRAELLKIEKDLIRVELVSALSNAVAAQAYQHRFNEALRLNEIVCELSEVVGGLSGKAQCHLSQGVILFHQKKLSASLEKCQLALTMFREAKDKLWEARALIYLGQIYEGRKKYADALTEYGASLTIARETGDRGGEARAIGSIGNIYRLTARYDEALTELGACLKLMQEIRDRAGEALTHFNIGETYRLEGKYPDALTQYETSLTIARQIRDRAREARSLGSIGIIYWLTGRHEEALKELAACLQIMREIGDGVGEAAAHFYTGEIYGLRGKYADALAEYQASLTIARETGDRGGEARAIGSIGNIYRLTARYDEALKEFASCLQMMREINDKDGEAATHFNIGVVYQSRGNSQEALEQFETSLRIAREIKDKNRQAAALNGFGVVYRSRNKYADALTHIEEALTLAREVNDRVLESEVLANIAVVYLMRGNYAGALTQCEASLRIAREMGDRRLEAIVLIAIGDVHELTGRYAESLSQFENSLKIANETGNKLQVAQAINGIGNVYQATGRYSEAIARYETGLKIAREIGDKRGQSAALNGIGIVYRSTGRYAEALAHYESSLRIADELDDKALDATALNNIGGVYSAIGRTADGLAKFEASLKIRRELGDKGGEAEALGNMGTAYEVMNDYTKALAHYADSLKIKREIGDRPGEAATLGNIGVIYELTEKYSEALSYYEASLKIKREIGDRSGEAGTLLNIGNVYRFTDRISEAMLQYEESRKIFRAIGDNAGEASLLTNVAEGHRFLKQWQQAADTYRQSIQLIEQTREHIREPSLQTSYFARYTWPYYGLIKSLMELGSTPEELFAVSERSRARSLVELMASGKVRILKSMTDAERQAEQDLNARIIAAMARLNNAQSRTGPDQERVPELIQDLKRARDDYEEFRHRLFVAHPELQARRAAFDPPRLDQLSAALFAKEPDLCVLSYLVDDNRTFLFVITRGKNANSPVTLRVQTIKTDKDRELRADELNRRLNEFRLRYTNQSGIHRRQAQEIYELLLAPAEKELAGKTHVVVITDGALRLLPFHALIDPNGKHFIESHSVSYAPSVTALIEMMKLADQKRTNTYSQPLFAMGRRWFPDQAKYSNWELKYAEAEVKSIAGLFDATPLTGIEATEAKAKLEMEKARFVHFATHGELNQVQPMYSAIVLGKGPNDDGMLYTRELVDMDLQAELVVLSACYTGLGAQVNGEGIIGLTWSLFVAGSPSSVVTQWKVNDDSMNKLMLEFYQRMRQTTLNGQPLSKAEALRRAQLSLMKNEAYNHPFHWAPVTLVGDWR